MSRLSEERQWIIEWIQRLQTSNDGLKAHYRKYERDIRYLINDFIQVHGYGADAQWRNPPSRAEMRDLRTAIEALMDTTLTEEAQAQIEDVQSRRVSNLMDYLELMIVVETIRVMNYTQITFEMVIEDTIRDEITRRASGLNINITGQYVEDNIDAAIRDGLRKTRYLDYIWESYGKNLESEVSRIIRDSVIRGVNPKDLVEELQKTVQISEYNAERLLWTEQASVQGDLQMKMYKAQKVELYDFIVEPSACRDCKAIAASNPHRVEDAIVGVNVQPLHPNCRCSTSARIPLNLEERDLSEIISVDFKIV